MSANEKSTYEAWIEGLHSRALASNARVSDDAELELLDHLIRGLDAVSGSLSLLDPDGTGLTLVAGTGSAKTYIGKKFVIGDGIIGRVAAARRPLLLTGKITDQPSSVSSDRSDENRPSSSLCWPLFVTGQLRGVVCVNRMRGNEPFVDTDLERGQFMANLLAIVVENLHLRRSQTRRLNELDQLNVQLRAKQAALEEAYAQQQALIDKLQETQHQLLQSEKMAAIGQLAAGVAHEINNPIGYVNSNLGVLQRYLADLFALLDALTATEQLARDKGIDLGSTDKRKPDVDADYLKQDLRALVEESTEGVGRVKQIVSDLKEFSHVGDATFAHSDLHRGLDSTLNIVANEIKYKAKVVKDYGDLPMIECIPSQLNQVFMNLLVNAAQAMESQGTITIRTYQQGEGVVVEVIDTGKGIPPEHLKRIFDPFFTTKPVGEGTGLGLSLSYSIVQKHQGRIEVASEVGKGTTFRVWLPERQRSDGREATCA